jgi:hypothetical protein
VPPTDQRRLGLAGRVVAGVAVIVGAALALPGVFGVFRVVGATLRPAAAGVWLRAKAPR